MLAAILQHISSSSTRGCKRLLAGDGITAVNFTVSAVQGLLEEGVSIDARAARKKAPALGDTFGIAKNLDEYQLKICALVPTLADSPLKTRLQKYRIAIIASFAALVPLVRQGGRTEEWNGHARALLVEASDLYVMATASAAAAASRGQQGQELLPQSKIAGALAFFGVPEDRVDRALASMYGSADSEQ